VKTSSILNKRNCKKTRKKEAKKMTTDKTQTPDGYLKDGQGRLVPLETVRPQDILENAVVLEMFAEAERLNKALDFFKQKTFADIDAFIDLLREKYNVSKGGTKGNVTFVSYDGMTKVQVSNADFLSFGAELQVAKELIDECIKSWGAGSNAQIVALVNHAFRVDKQGKVNKDDILGLRKIDIKDEKWQRAMTAISDSIRVTRSKRYIRFYQRPAPEMDFEPVNLDLAKV
jgi:hypothetical protein